MAFFVGAGGGNHGSDCVFIIQLKFVEEECFTLILLCAVAGYLI